MKILVIPSWYPPLGGRFFEELSKSIASENVSVDILFNEEKSMKRICINDFFETNVFEKDENINIYRTAFYRIPKLNILNERRYVKSCFRNYKKYAKKYGHPDIIHVHSVLWAGVVANKIFEKFKIPFVITEHRSRFIANMQQADDLIKKRFIPKIKISLRNAAYVTCVSPALYSKLIDIEPVVSAKLVTIPNTIDSSDFYYTHSVKNEQFTFFCLANLTFVKGVDILLKAFSIVLKTFSRNIILNIGGNGPELTNLKNMAASLKISDNVNFLLKLSREQVIEQMKKSEAFVLSSRFEAFGVVYIEAAASGLPLIATKSGGPEFIVNSENGFLSENENAEMLAEKIIEMIKNYDRFDREKISRNAIEKYDKNFVSKQYIVLFNKILVQKDA